MKASPAAVDAMYRAYTEEFPEVDDIAVHDLLLLDESDVVLVDVRGEEERAISSIPGSISAVEFAETSDQLSDRLIVPFCTIGYRSGVFAQQVLRDGHRVRNLRGGILAWCHAGQPVTGGGRDRSVHVYGRRWNLLPDTYHAVW